MADQAAIVEHELRICDFFATKAIMLQSIANMSGNSRSGAQCVQRTVYRPTAVVNFLRYESIWWIRFHHISVSNFSAVVRNETRSSCGLRFPKRIALLADLIVSSEIELLQGVLNESLIHIESFPRRCDNPDIVFSMRLHTHID